MSHILHRSLGGAPAVAASGRGVFLVTEDGREVLDAAGGAAVSCLGHAHPAVVAAVQAQVAALDYAHTGSFSSRPAEELADLLVGHAPGGLTHAVFVSSGSEACEAALKIARQYFLEIGQPERGCFIARRQSYHGNTLGALAAGGNMARREPFAPLLADCFSHVTPAFAYRYARPGENEAAFVARLAAELEAAFQRLGPGQVAGFLAETVGGATPGAVPPPAGYFRAVREVCDRHGALLILDEVMCGMGRTGTTHAWEQEGVSPDIEIVAKGLGGGVQPIAAVLVGGRIVDAIRAGSGVLRHGHTYMGHPVACAAALAVQRTIATEGLLDCVRARGAQLRAALEARFGAHPHVGDIRGRGLFLALELVAGRASRAPFAPELGLAGRVKRAALERGLACYPSSGTIDGVRGDHVLLAPPYIVTPEQIETIVARLNAAITAALASLPS